MESYERAFIDTVANGLSASIANNVRENGNVTDLVEDESHLSDLGRMFVRGYLTGRLAMIRSGAVGNPNLSPEDLEEVISIVEENESRIASELHA